MDIARKRSRAELRWRRKCLEKRKLFSGKSESGTKEENNEMLGLECSTVCSRDVDVGADRRRSEAFEMWIWRRMEKISWLDKVNEEILAKGNINGLAIFWDMTDFCMKLLKTEWNVNQQEGEEEFKCYMIWQMMVAMLHSNGQLRTERDEDTEIRCHKPAVQ